MKKRILSVCVAMVVVCGLIVIPQNVVVSANNSVQTIAGGLAHSTAIKADGSLWSWGRNYEGQLGDGTAVSKSLPTKIINDVVSASVAYNYSMAIKTDGSLWAWGDNNAGQLGDGTTASKNTPTKIMDSVVSVYTGGYHSMAIKTDGSLWSWGYNVYGQLGDGTTTDRNTPIKIMDNIVSVSVNYNYTMAIKTDGTLWAWGYNYNGQLGDGTTISKNTPVKIMDSVASVYAGSYHSMAIKTDGSLWSWGCNVYGLLGDGTTTDRNTPMKIMDNIISVYAGNYHNMIIKTDGSLWTWGDNYYGQLGDGTSTIRYSPIKIMDNIVSVYAGDYHSMAVKTDGSLWAWGDNGYGQLGDGTTINRDTPVKIMEGIMLPNGNNETPSTTTPTYKDLLNDTLPSDWAREECTYALENKLIPDDMFNDFRENITRADFCRLAVRLIEIKSGKSIETILGLETGNSTLSYPFDDTKDDNVSVVYALGIVNGRDGKYFAPNDTITREESATLLTRLAKFMLLDKPNGIPNAMSDVSQSPEWAKDGIAFINACYDSSGNRIMNGTGDGMFSPKDTYTNEQAFITFGRLYNCLNEQEKPIIVRALSVCGDDGNDTKKHSLEADTDVMTTLLHFKSCTGTYNDNVTTMIMPTYKELKDAISKTAYDGATWQDVSYFYFGGHGYEGIPNGGLAINQSGVNNWEPYSYMELMNDLSNIKGTVIVIIDACFAGTIKINNDLGETDINKDKFKILMATNYDQFAMGKPIALLDHITQKWRNKHGVSEDATYTTQHVSVYTSYIGDGCGYFDEIYPADTNKDGEITLNELHAYLSTQLDKKYKDYKMSPQVFPDENDQTVIFKY